MNIANSLRAHYVFCGGGFVPLPDTHGYVEYEQDKTSYNQHFGLDPTADEDESGWHIDFSHFGNTFAVIPSFDTALPPLRIDLRIPDQTTWPSELWSILGARDSVHMHGPRINSLGIAHHLRRALTHWSRHTPDFEQQYRSLPFGSRIITPQIYADPNQIIFKFKPEYGNRLVEQLLSISALEKIWEGIPGITMPPTVPWTKLQYRKQLASQVALVSLDNKEWVFKSRTSGPASLYHELKVLFTQPHSQHTVDSPAYLVTTFSSEHNEERVCGFLMKYYNLGTLATTLPMRRRDGTLTLKKQLQWAKDVTSALLHVTSNSAKFYSDLRMDNLVLDDQTDRPETAVLIDFEQGRNVYNWAPPEIYYLEWVAELGCKTWANQTPGLDQKTKDRFSRLLERYLAVIGHEGPLLSEPDIYDNAPLGWYFPWVLSSQEERNAGEVYLLGKALWCIFEGRGDADIILGRGNVEDGEQRFPEFRLTPEPLRKLITDCTAGAREWKDGPLGIYRRGGQIFPLGKTGLNGEPEGTFEETKAVIANFWQKEMDKAECFLEARMKYYQGKTNGTDMEWLDYLKRPSLTDVLQTLQSFVGEQKL